jgi:TetR/AcrR family transcriptional repressor of mexJK operon
VHQPSVPGRAGRPKDSGKRASIIKAAISLFASQPFDLVTMEAVASLAGVSKMTVYSHFTDKDFLFESAIAAMADSMIGHDQLVQEPATSLKARLVQIGTSYLTAILGPHVTTMAFALPSAIRANRDLAVRFYNAGPGRTKADLASVISSAVERKELVVDSAELAAYDLISLWEGGLPGRIAFGLAESATPEEAAQRAQRGTEVFLRAYSAPRKRRS